MSADLTFKDVVVSPHLLRGARSVGGPALDAVLCFLARLERHAKSIAEAAQSQPYVLLIGNSTLKPPHRGSVLELVRTTPRYGATVDFVRGDKNRTLLKDWPVAVALSEVYKFNTPPSLIDDLSFSDGRFLMGSRGGRVVDSENLRLWRNLRDCKIERRSDLSSLS